MRISENISKKDFYMNLTVSDKTKALSITEYLFLTYIIFLPIQTSDYLQFNVSFLRISVVDILLSATLYFVLIKRIATNSQLSFIPIKFVLFFSLAIISSTISFFYLPWNEDIFYDIKTTLNFFEFLAVFYVTMSIVRNKAMLDKVLFTLCISLLAFSVLTILKSIGFDVPGFQRGGHVQFGPFDIGTIALFESIMPISLLTLMTFPIVISGTVIKRLWFRVPLIVIYLTAALITFSRSLWIALILQIFPYIYFIFFAKIGLMKKIFFICFIPALILLLYAYFNEIYLFIEDIRPHTIRSRLHGYQVAIDRVLSQPHFLLFGAGKGSYIQSYSWFEGRASSIHNFALDILVGKGLVTLLFLLSSIYIIIYDLFKIKKIDSLNTNSYSILFIVAISGIIMEGMMAPITNSLIFWTSLALAYSFILIVKRRI